MQIIGCPGIGKYKLLVLLIVKGSKSYTLIRITNRFFYLHCEDKTIFFPPQVCRIELGFRPNEIQHIAFKIPKILTANKKKLTETFDYVHNVMGIPHHILTNFPQVRYFLNISSNENAIGTGKLIVFTGPTVRSELYSYV